MKKKNLAFTLAEVLIVIGIIGVVAALTLPNLNHATGDKEKVTKVKKIYSNLTEAVDRAQAIYGPFDTWFKDLQNQYGGIDSANVATASERFAKRVTEFMKVSKDCGVSAGCFTEAPLLNVNGDEINENDLESMQGRSYYMVILTDGVSLSFCYQNDNVGMNKIQVDIDGPNKGKNQDGNDRFNFTVSSQNNILPSPGTDDANYDFVTDSCVDYYYTWWVITNDNVDYFKCPGDLVWETKTSCE